MRVARLTVDLLRPVPVAPLTFRSEVLREGRKIQLIAVHLESKGVEVARAMRAAATADFSNGISSELDFAKWAFINADLTVSMARDPVGEWILNDATTSLGTDGGGIAQARLADRRGYFGPATQNLVVEPR